MKKVTVQHHLVVRGCYFSLRVFDNVKMARTKQTARRANEKEKMNKHDFVKEPYKWGDAAKVGSHQPPRPPPRDNYGLPSYKGM